MVLITYDVNTETKVGKRRLQQVAKHCQNFGQRVQNSVFECVMDTAKLKELQYKIAKTIDPEKDSVRYYYLGDEWRKRVEHIGAKPALDLEGALIV